MLNVNVKFIPYARVSYLVVNGKRYVVKMRRKMIIVNKFTKNGQEKVCNGTVNKFCRLLSNFKRKCADTFNPLPYEDEIIQSRDYKYASPGIFKHLYTFHAMFDNKVIPVSVCHTPR